MFLDHPSITATNSELGADRIERLNRGYGCAMALADSAGDAHFVDKLTQLHDHKGTLIAFWNEPPSEAERGYLVRAWASKVGDGTGNVEHEC